ncbi:siderophore ABC transporter substrate-binding protein [Alkalihalophilus pseudofirmus]|uniref:siderophore ABC transporter substrate-binding protein n=1 Tax=Alkalihalophilus pseudofirmus TaxID=79885 RepID=UPI00259B6079|nr:siderophore ABC transporter substrate-binding protein [Alkalihalophilus pseudofirmus]WEG16880.1 siderophore ABC transporter substrate-binding protein [Alkalihalophilus pseudofirmus]
MSKTLRSLSLRPIMFLFVLVIFAGVLAACGSDNAEEASADVNAEAEETEGVTEDTEEADADADAEASEVTITHDLGEAVVPKNPETVVVFDMGVLDTLDTLGVNVTALPQENVPDYLEKYKGEEYQNAGTLFEPDFEAIYGMEPDLIIISGRAAEAYDELNEIAPTIFMGVDTANYVESFKGNVTTLAEIFEKEEEAAEKLAAIEQSIEELHETATASETSGLLIMANDGDISAYGPGSRFGLLHDDFGVTPTDDSIEVTNHGQNISFEYIVEQDPEYLFVIDRAAVVGGESSGQQTVENELVKTTRAYEEGNIVYLDPVNWYITSGGLTAVSEMVEEVKAGIE